MTHTHPDQSRDTIATQAWHSEKKLAFSAKECEVLRALAGEVASLAARPTEVEKRALWARHNALEKTRPPIFCDPENGWKEIITPNQLLCESTLARNWEFHLRKEIFWGTDMQDDYTIKPFFDIPHTHKELDWGIEIVRIGGEDGGAYTWKPQIETEADIQKIRSPEILVDHDATEQVKNLADGIFGDLLTIRVKTSWWWSLVRTQLLLEWRGWEQLMLDIYDQPQIIHQTMSRLRDGTLTMLDKLETAGYLSLNSDGSYVGSGGLGWTTELPQPDFDGSVRCKDMWGFSESQEAIGLSPKMFADFIFPYQKPILERFGLNCYGCCEPIESRWETVKQIRNLRRISVSPWADRQKMADVLEDKYIYSLKPNPVALATGTFDEEHIRADLRNACQIARDCHLEVIMKDNHTINHDPQRVIRWVQIAREEIENL